MKLLAALLAAAAVPAALAADAEAWKARNIYFVLTDRIARGSDDTGGDACGNLGNYCGGTFQGLQSKLDYIQGMGFDAIWLTPVITSRPPPDRVVATCCDEKR
jgi:alpha-amylase